MEHSDLEGLKVHVLETDLGRARLRLLKNMMEVVIMEVQGWLVMGQSSHYTS